MRKLFHRQRMESSSQLHVFWLESADSRCVCSVVLSLDNVVIILHKSDNLLGRITPRPISP